jgi:hypothetical protein
VQRAVGALALASAVSLASSALAGDAAQPAPLTATQDHQRVMDLLGVKELRHGRDGNPNGANPANYDEAKSNPYPKLPDPLLTNDGRKVTTADLWWKVRRPEIVEAFDREIYGRAPAVTPEVTWDITSTKDEMVGSVPAVTRSLVGHVDNATDPAVTVNIELTLTTPKAAKKPVPAFLRFGFRFPPGFKLPAPPAGSPPAPPPGPSVEEQVLAKGWAYAEVMPNSVQADNGDGLQAGIIGLVNKGQPRKLDDWGVLRAWAWGASRALDYFETVPEIDAKRVAIEGLSRYGKAALVTMAYDQRFSIGYIGSSGEGGAKLSRRDNGEIVENLAGGEYHWMAGNFLKYAGPLNWSDLPVDAHELIALAAPRPVFIGTGSPSAGDAWVDPKGMFMAEAAASPVYELLGRKGLGADQMPAVGVGLTDGALAWRQHEQGHTSGPNWDAYLKFAAKWWGEE